MDFYDILFAKNLAGNGGDSPSPSPSPSEDGYEITNPVLALNISGLPRDLEDVCYVDENGYLTSGSIFDAYGETKLVIIADDGDYVISILKPQSYSNEVNCTAEEDGSLLIITITDPTQDASIDVEYGLD